MLVARRTLLTSLVSSAIFAAAGETVWAASLTEVKKRGVIHFATSADAPPFGYLDPHTGRLTGISVKLADAIAHQLGVKVKFATVPFSGLIGEVTSGRADVLAGALFITPERAKAVAFSDPLYGWGPGILVPDSSHKTYPNVESLSGSTVGVLTSSVQYAMLKNIHDVSIRSYTDYITLVADLRAGRIDAALVDPPPVIYIMREDHVAGLKFQHDYKPPHVFYVGMAVAKTNTTLLAAIDEIIAKMKSDGQLAKILSQWGMSSFIAK